MKIYLSEKHDFESYLQQCRANRWRGFIHIAGEHDWAKHYSTELIESLQLAPVLTLEPDLQQAQRQLGSECKALLLDAYAGFNPSVFAMLSACLQGGGVLILLTPALADWPDLADPDYKRMLSVADSQQKIAGRFLRRCADYLRDFTHRISVTENGVTFAQLVDQNTAAIDYTAQEAAIRAIKKTAEGRANRPLVLSADRGRGKSSAIGIACAQLMRTRAISIAVCAPSVQSVGVLFQHIAEQLGQEVGGMHYVLAESSVRFYAIDELIQAKPACRLLIIDEAAAIPTAQLALCAQHFTRIVFSTTLQGYEGNGRGFELRFLPYLQQKMPQLKRIQLDVPMRWAAGDPLEQWVNRLLLLDVTLAEPSSIADYKLEELEQAELMQNEQQLRQLLAVLLLAHYQTSPDDLRILLDHPLLRIYVIKQGDLIVAAALLMQEGNFNAHWQQQLQQGRRCAGHILPQALWGDGFNLLDKKFWRVLRIAVRPDLQGQGLGSRLLNYVQLQLSGDFIGASFSADADTVRFWQVAGFRPCRIGSHKESSTGLYACLMLKALNYQAVAAVSDLHQHFCQQISLVLLMQNQTMDSSSVIALLKHAAFTLKPHAIQQAIAYSEAKRGYEQSLVSLHALVLYAVANAEHPHLPLLVDKLLLNQDWQLIAERYNLAGRKAVEVCMRDALQQLCVHLAQE